MHTPPIGLGSKVSPRLTVVIVVAFVAFLVAPPMVVLLLPLAFVTWLLWWFFTGRQEAAERMAAGGACPSCEYELTGLVAEQDGATVCPECGAAWKLADG